VSEVDGLSAQAHKGTYSKLKTNAGQKIYQVYVNPRRLRAIDDPKAMSVMLRQHLFVAGSYMCEGALINARVYVRFLPDTLLPASNSVDPAVAEFDVSCHYFIFRDVLFDQEHI
jgi:hypothetical protein